MAEDERCPCDAVKELQRRDSVRNTCDTQTQVSLAVITTRLNALTGIMSVIGIALVGICLKLLFPGV
jgi:hypothetical protein